MSLNDWLSRLRRWDLTTLARKSARCLTFTRLVVSLVASVAISTACDLDADECRSLHCGPAGGSVVLSQGDTWLKDGATLKLPAADSNEHESSGHWALALGGSGFIDILSVTLKGESPHEFSVSVADRQGPPQSFPLTVHPFSDDRRLVLTLTALPSERDSSALLEIRYRPRGVESVKTYRARVEMVRGEAVVEVQDVIDFGLMRISVYESRPLTISNSGLANALITDIVVSGPAPLSVSLGHFSEPIRIAPGAEYTFSVICSPIDDSPISGEILIVTERGPDHTVIVTGQIE